MTALTVETVEKWIDSPNHALNNITPGAFRVLCAAALAALSERGGETGKPVAWMWLEGVEMMNGNEVEQFERVNLSREKPAEDAYGLTPLYTRPQAGQGKLPGFIKPDTDTHVYFYEQDHYYLSNFSAFQVNFDGTTFNTSEEAYHYQRFAGNAECRRAILWAKSAHEAFRYAQENKRYQIPEWDQVKVDIMRDILRAKVAQHEYVHRKLLQTGNKELIEDSHRDPYWGWGPNADGLNMLGKLWMEVRSELLSAQGGSHG